ERSARMSATASLTTLRHIGPIYRLIVGAIPISIASHLAHLLASCIRPVSEESYRKNRMLQLKIYARRKLQLRFAAYHCTGNNLQFRRCAKAC
ncbi:MAG: hypothetical protein QOG55_1892, partial [Acidobacteriaceae bacterium]|nr:hypothetical protein [Acidobacteriaceae bacterium]